VKVLLFLLILVCTFLSNPVFSNAQTSQSKLHWSPPSLENPTTITLGTGPTTTNMDPTKDYIIVLPTQKKNGTTRLVGGRNIVIKGGYVTIPSGASASDQKAFRITNATGTVHIEGVLIDSSGGSESDGVFIDAPEAIVQLQNLRIVGLHGTEATNHSDIVQAHLGHRELRIDRLTGTSNYQGFLFGEHDGPGDFGPIEIRNVDMTAIDAPDSRTLIWMAAENHDWLMNYRISFSNVWLQGLSRNSIFRVVKPHNADESPWTAVLSNGNQISWPYNPTKIQGFVFVGRPPGGDFVPQGTVGLNYVSPGYESDPLPTETTFIVGDINQDHIVDLSDYSILISQFFKTGNNLSADLDQDGIVDLNDYAILVANFFKRS
jgi:hypothetical protein